MAWATGNLFGSEGKASMEPFSKEDYYTEIVRLEDDSMLKLIAGNFPNHIPKKITVIRNKVCEGEQRLMKRGASF